MKKVYHLLFFLYFSVTLLAQTELRVSPKTTDSAIDDWLEDNYIFINKNVPQMGKLVILLPGSGLNPSSYLLILRSAANRGYNVIGLKYPNTFSLAELCSKSTDSSCYEKVRLEVLDGTDRTQLVSVSRANSLENRLSKLLIYMKENYSEGQWDLFLKPDKTPEWSNIIVIGHSLGGGMAAIMAQRYYILRVVMLASPTDYSDYFNRPAFYLGKPHLTPSSHYFGFGHKKDAIVRYEEIWKLLGMDQFGPLINVDTTLPPYLGTHMLSTGMNPPESDYHGSVAMDLTTPKNQDGSPVFSRVWEYMAYPVQILDRAEKPPELAGGYSLGQNYPNPFNPATNITFRIPAEVHVRLSVVNVLGNEIAVLLNEEMPAGEHTVRFNAGAHSLTAGVYFFRISAGSFYSIKKMVLLK
ncbi:MAG: T9SS type A sorting domain-containing protein [Ignavibacteria bacterium]|nr:T9SS type A sorting domain-containing protein [Ignavibacteria bacterium]MCU7504898.1 T9SS type A sorting domain-containing protein [Ignavibacteria bacterium]MCU7517810.1 T9SS type A sorting domain-containing protein [Ignavibacteria bacterium]